MIDGFKESNQEKKQRYDLRAILLLGAIEKNPIFSHFPLLEKWKSMIALKSFSILGAPISFSPSLEASG